MIRRATYEDIPMIQKIAVESWRQTYQQIIPPKLQQQFLAFDYNYRQLRHRIDTTLFFVALQQDVIVGFANFSIGTRNELETIYLSPAVFSEGIGHQLLVTGESFYPAGTELYVRVNALNERAIAFDKSGVKYLGTHNLSINDFNAEVMGSPTIYAPNSTVTMGGKYTNVTATVSENTLRLQTSFHALSLNVLKGKVIFYGVDIKDFADEIVNEKIEYNPYTLEINNTNFNKLSSKSGVYNFAEDIDINKGVAFRFTAKGKYIYNLNNHEIKCGSTSLGSIFLNGSVDLTINGEGKLINNANSYGVWVSGKDCVLNVNGGDFEADTHALYAENGTINVYGGTFKMLGEPELDSKGHCKFMLNCYDKSYTEGTAKINVYGGKFYNYNPSESYSEPNGPVSFVAEGYHVVESIEDGVPVFEVVKD